MPSSTSSSRPDDQHDSFVRPVPHGNWVVSFAVAVAVTLAVITAWELHVRSEGYPVALNETGDLWAANRTLLAESPGRDVVIGSSRIQFDFDLDEYARYFNTEKPIQLALPGAVPLPVLEQIADDESFTGTALVGVVPGLYFAPPNTFPVNRALEAIDRYEKWSPSQITGHYLGMFLERRLAFLNQEDLTLPHLVARLNIPNRPGAKTPPVFPPFFATATEDRRARMWERCDFGTPLAQRIQQIWIPLFTPPPPPPFMTEDEFKALFMQSVESYLERTKAAVDKIHARGGRVVFIRMPSTDTLREMENKFSPRPVFWEAIIARTGAPGIHFEDYPELSEFKCPEWSHLRAADADEFSKRLMPILDRVLTGATDAVN